MTAALDDEVLKIEDLRVSIPTPVGVVHALRGVDLAARRGRIVGVVGESGSGKTMTGRAVIGLLPRSATATGRITLDGTELVGLSERELARRRGKQIAMIFQDPSAALNPVFTVGQQLDLVLKRHGVVPRRRLRAKSIELLSLVGLPAPRRLLDTYPHQLSGGMQQRVMIAIAISTDPLLLIADEPTSSLDVTIQRQILDLLCQLRDERRLTVMLITHNMGVVAQACQDVAVVYAGRTVEAGPAEHVMDNAKHPYTQALLAAQPKIGDRNSRLAVIPGSVPAALAEVVGCAFAPRCPFVMTRCREELPASIEIDERLVACHLYSPNSLSVTRS